MNRAFLLAAALTAALPSTALPCSLCGGDFRNRLTLRQEMAAAHVVVVGTLANARANDDSGEGRTDLRIDWIVKGVGEFPATVTIPRYYPGDGNGPQRGVFFFELRDGKLQFIGGRTVRTAEFTAYLKSVAAIEGNDLTFFARQLDHADADAAGDAFLELARAPDAEVARVARAVPAARLRKLLADPKTPPERIGLVAFLLACAGDAKDAALLLGMIRDLPEDRHATRRGLLAGYMVLKPNEGWALAQATIADAKRGFLERYAVIGVLEFFHNWQPEAHRDRIVRGFRAAMQSPDLADMVVEDLRRWQWWELTDAVIGAFDKPGFDSEMVRRAILRYALVCPRPAARRFADGVKKRETEFFAEVARSLEDER